jgi:hypothetical protein
MEFYRVIVIWNHGSKTYIGNLFKNKKGGEGKLFFLKKKNPNVWCSTVDHQNWRKMRTIYVATIDSTTFEKVKYLFLR